MSLINQISSTNILYFSSILYYIPNVLLNISKLNINNPISAIKSIYIKFYFYVVVKGFRFLFINTPTQKIHAWRLTQSQDSPPENVPRNPRGVIGGLSGSYVTAKKLDFKKGIR